MRFMIFPHVLTLFCPCNSQLEGALSRWTSYQEDVGQFVLWMDRVEQTLSCSERQFSEMRDKTANLGKTKVLHSVESTHYKNFEDLRYTYYFSSEKLYLVLFAFQLLYEEVLNHISPLETIATKASNMTEPYTIQQEVHQLQSRYNTLKDQAKVDIKFLLTTPPC